MRERFVVPKGRVLEDEPAARLANATPSLSLVAMSTDPTRRVKVAFETEILLTRGHLRVLGVHILGRRRDLLLAQGAKQVGRVG